MSPAGAAMDRFLIQRWGEMLAGLSRRPVARSSFMFFETALGGSLLAADEHMGRRRELEAAVLALLDDRGLSPRDRRRAVKLLGRIREG